MHKFYRHFQIFTSLLRISLLGIFLFTSTLSFAFHCWNHDTASFNQNSNRVHENTLENELHHNADEDDEDCHTSEKVQKDTSILLKKEPKIPPIFHVYFPDTYSTNKTNTNLWFEKRVVLREDPPIYSHTHLVWIVIFNC